MMGENKVGLVGFGYSKDESGYCTYSIDFFFYKEDKSFIEGRFKQEDSSDLVTLVIKENGANIQNEYYFLDKRCTHHRETKINEGKELCMLMDEDIAALIKHGEYFSAVKRILYELKERVKDVATSVPLPEGMMKVIDEIERQYMRLN
jgi:hypothetical protein